MKNIVLILIAFISLSSYCQVDRRIGRGQYTNTSKNSQKGGLDFTEQTLDFFRKEIQIDGFQEAVIKNALNDHEKNSKEIIESESIETPEKKEILLTITEKFKNQLAEILTKEQFEKYNEVLESKKKQNRKKK